MMQRVTNPEARFCYPLQRMLTLRRRLMENGVTVSVDYQIPWGHVAKDQFLVLVTYGYSLEYCQIAFFPHSCMRPFMRSGILPPTQQPVLRIECFDHKDTILAKWNDSIFDMACSHVFAMNWEGAEESWSPLFTWGLRRDYANWQCANFDFVELLEVHATEAVFHWDEYQASIYNMKPINLPRALAFLTQLDVTLTLDIEVHHSTATQQNNALKLHWHRGSPRATGAWQEPVEMHLIGHSECYLNRHYHGRRIFGILTYRIGCVVCDYQECLVNPPIFCFWCGTQLCEACINKCRCDLNWCGTCIDGPGHIRHCPYHFGQNPNKRDIERI